MELVPLILGTINLALLLVVLVKLGKISRQLEIPIVKKLTPELKLKPAKHRMNKPSTHNSEEKQGNKRSTGNRNKNPRHKEGDNRNNNRRRRPNKNRFEGSSEVLSNQKEGAKKPEATKQNEGPKSAAFSTGALETPGAEAADLGPSFCFVASGFFAPSFWFDKTSLEPSKRFLFGRRRRLLLRLSPSLW
jgi:hypothetical protein